MRCFCSGLILYKGFSALLACLGILLDNLYQKTKENINSVNDNTVPLKFIGGIHKVITLQFFENYVCVVCNEDYPCFLGISSQIKGYANSFH